MLCKQCGFNLSNQANFCPSCGAKIPDEDRKSDAPQKHPAKWLKILLGFILAGLAGFALLILVSDHMTDTVSDQLQAIKENRLTEAYYDYTSHAFQQATSVERFREFMGYYSAFSHNKSVRFIDRNMENNIGSLHAMILTDDGVEVPVQYQLVKEGDKWLIESIKLEDVDEEKEVSGNKEHSILITPIEFQLKSFQKREIKQSYDALSKEYQDKMPWEKFETFVKSHPIFFQYKSVNYESIQSDKETAIIQANLESRKDQAVVRYHLKEENGQWEIADVEFVGHEPTRDMEQLKKDDIFDNKPLEGAIKGMMEEIRSQNYKKAYEGFTSSDFKKTTSFNEFEEFSKTNASFSQNESVVLDDLSFDNNVATMAGVLKGKNGKVYPAEFDLVEENDVWKVFHVQVLDPDERVRQAASALQISKFVLGSKLGDDGLIISPTTVFKTNSGDIYLNLYVNGIKPNTTIQVIFEHMDSRSRIPPVSKVVTDEGDVIVTFIFSPPPTGWPKGSYRLLANSSTGESGTFNFKVED